jgi:hypothetical protein
MRQTYVPKDPKEKLREVVVKWVTSMHSLGHHANRRVAFGGEEGSVGPPAAVAWLLDSSEVLGRHDRYLLFEDGEVWHELVIGPPISPEHKVEAREWLGGPDDVLITLLGHSLARVQYGDPHYRLCDDASAGPLVVPDRRRRRRIHAGPERRS